MTDSNFKYEIGNCSDVGKVREINEDFFGTFKGIFGLLLIVCDGMGGHKGGEIASRLSVETIKKHFEALNNSYDPSEELKLSIQAANNALLQYSREDSSLNAMGSTVVITLLKESKAFTANLGDSRIYLCRSGQIKQLTKDHSLVQQMVDSNMITQEEAKIHPKKNVITKSLGIGTISEPDIPEPISLQEGDIFVLCSDGLTTFVEDTEILNIITVSSAQESANKLIELANERGGSDNITVQIVKVIEDK